MAESSIKKSGVYGIFGKRYGDILINVLQGCCNGVADFGNVCTVVKDCIGIDEVNGDSNLFLNQKGEFISITGGGIQSIVEGDNITVDNTDPLNPIVSAIVPTYTFTSTDSIDLVDNVGVVTADIILDPNPLNIASVGIDGLLVLGTSTLFQRDIFENASGDIFTLTQIPNGIFPEMIRIGNNQLLPSEYTIAGNTLTLVEPITPSVGGAGGADLICTYSYSS